MTFNLFTSAWKIVLSFFTQLADMLVADFSYMTGWFGNEFIFFISSWSAYFSNYGVLMPAIFTAVILLSIVGAYATFVFFDGVNALVGGN